MSMDLVGKFGEKAVDWMAENPKIAAALIGGLLFMIMQGTDGKSGVLSNIFSAPGNAAKAGGFTWLGLTIAKHVFGLGDDDAPSPERAATPELDIG